MGSAFNPQILVEKLAKLNSSQASIETLSHWCIFHMNKARQVVETWARQFHSSPREQRLAFLYLANDILQNSRRKGAEFVGEFWKVLPDALRDVIGSGDEVGRNAAQRLINIWEERKVFGSRGQILKEEFVGRQLESNNRNGKHLLVRPPAGTSLDKIVSDYQAIYGQMDEDTILRKCKNAINCLEKADKEVGGDFNSGQFQGDTFAQEVHGQHAILRDCIDQLTAVESSRATLVSHLKEALQEQEFKLDQLRNQLQAAQLQSEQASNFCRQLMSSSNNLQPIDQNSKEAHTSAAPHSFMAVGREQSAPVMYTQQVPFTEKSGHVEEDPRKSAAAAVAAKLTASTSSAQMLSYVLSSLASEGVISNPTKGSSGDYPSEKRLKLDNDNQLSPYVPQNPNPSASSPFSHSESLQLNVSTTSQQYTPTLPPLPPSSPPPLPPLPPVSQYPVSQYLQAPGSTTSVSFSYSMAQPQTSSVPGYAPVGGAQVNGLPPLMAPANPYQSFQGSDGKFYNQQSSMQLAPMSRQ
ncbi:hypothetical protein RchiOBHm_Chr2g0176051 [Rosa chinensis]|uniref:CID domain-containing protein n=1 Tax=Rosa chinensis TaxID=74649 RepID=A0A2P6S6L0_ROSCH|nr:UPF0400 protein C337.03 [Rosa chinensis]XP_040370939.1 UPF0400 protein C337.03 [Rosa chinensis]PRQ54308.1 hypothetical protein RchiOBHm_Chr2g0176051 [Rosa chinensis]